MYNIYAYPFLERTITKLRRETKGDDQLHATFFSSPIRGQQIMTIDDVYQWSKTAHGGKQFELFSAERPTCEKWGLCHVK